MTIDGKYVFGEHCCDSCFDLYMNGPLHPIIDLNWIPIIGRDNREKTLIRQFRKTVENGGARGKGRKVGMPNMCPKLTHDHITNKIIADVVKCEVVKSNIFISSIKFECEREFGLTAVVQLCGAVEGELKLCAEVSQRIHRLISPTTQLDEAKQKIKELEQRLDNINVLSSQK
jgi:hypothetical protein